MLFDLGQTRKSYHAWQEKRVNGERKLIRDFFGRPPNVEEIASTYSQQNIELLDELSLLLIQVRANISDSIS
jgi:hypothetical protein